VSAGVYHASVGAVETLPIVQVTNVGEGIRRLKDAGFWAVAASLGEGSTVPWEVPDFEKVVLVLGAELEGISPAVEKLCDWKVRIPILGKIESLNVSAAGAVLMYEWARRAQVPVKP
jgi:23S rRNA (guanosine2251-2'-O)-methyltransferase